jgi:putative ABC transport system permease protein
MPARSAGSASRPRLPLVLHLLGVLTWPHWREHAVRTGLAVVGIALGVATVIGVADVSQSVLVAFERTVRTVAGASDLEITTVAADVDERLVTDAGGMPGVRAAAGLVEAFVPLADRPEEALYLLGIDFLGSPLWADQLPRAAVDIPDELAFIAQPDSVVVTRAFAARAGLAEGGVLRIVAPAGPRALRVRGFLGDAPVGRLFDGMIGVMDLPSAQRLLDRRGRVDRIGVQVTPGAASDEVRGRLARALGPGVEVAAPEARGRHGEKLLFSLRSMLVTASSLAVIVGAFITYQTMAVSVQQRRRQFALLNTVGVTRQTVVRLCLVETAILAALGVAFGTGAGRLLAALAVGVVGDTASEIWVPLVAEQRVHSVTALAIGAGVGLVTALAGAYVAVRGTLAAPGVEALRPTGVWRDDFRTASWTIPAGVLLIGATWLIAAAPPGLGFAAIVTLIIATQAAAYAGGAMLGPSLVSAVGQVARRVAGRTTRLPVRLAAENLPRGPTRSGTTVAIIAAALGMAVTLTGLVHSFEKAWLGWIDEHFGADLFVGSGGRFRLLAGPPMRLEVGDEIAALPGVDSVEPFRVLSATVGDQPVFLQGISIRERLARGGLAMVEGDLATAAPALHDGSGVLVSDNLAYRLGLGRGDAVDLGTPSGPRRFRVEGTFVDYLGSLDLGAIGIDQEQLDRIWGDRFANLFRVWLEPGASPSAARAAVLGRLGGGYYVLTAGQFLDGVRSVLSQFFLATWALQLVAALVGVIGVVNAQVATVLDRSVEISVLRTIGLRTRDVTRAVVLECSVLGALGGALGAVLGAMLGAQFVGISLRWVTGWRIPFELPLAPVLASVALAALLSALAGYVPARAAARLDARQRSLD